MDNVQRLTGLTEDLLYSGSIDCSRLFLHMHGKLPSQHSINQIDEHKASKILQKDFASEVTHAYHKMEHVSGRRAFRTDEAVYILSSGEIVSLECATITFFHDNTNVARVEELLKRFVPCKSRMRKPRPEISIVFSSQDGFNSRSLSIKKTQLDLNLFYEDDFAPVHQDILARLNKKNDKGVVLLHGPPGTGKTSYLRYLVGLLKKEVIFLPPSIADQLTLPGFIEFLASRPNSVLVIEDAENVILDRKVNQSAGVSNLLNISDGLLSDFLSIQIICTFNAPFAVIDQALVRQGRLIARYEFGKLSVSKAQNLADHLAIEKTVTRPMTLAEITNPSPVASGEKVATGIGFKRESMQN